MGDSSGGHWWIGSSAVLALFLADCVRCQTVAPQHGVQFIRNEEIVLGIDLGMGGSVTHLSAVEDDLNIINSFDLGREVQMAFYSGPVPFVPNRAPDDTLELHPRWADIGWNATMAGDAWGNNSKILEFEQGEDEMYVKLIPMHFPLNGYPSECTLECRYKLEGNTVEVWCRLNNARPDRTQYAARDQELPAVYGNGPWSRVVTYSGDRPFTGGGVTHIPRRRIRPGQYPVTRVRATENWIALVNWEGKGLGIWNPTASEGNAGFVGPPGPGGPKDAPTGHFAFVRREVIDWNISYEYEYVMIVGALTDIREYVYDHTSGPVYDFDFTNTRGGWRYENARDAGWPIEGALSVTPVTRGSALVSPALVWDRNIVTSVEVDADFGVEGRVRVFWSTHSDPDFIEARGGVAQVRPGRNRVRVPLGEGEMIAGLKIVLPNGPGQTAKIYGVRAVQRSGRLLPASSIR